MGYLLDTLVQIFGSAAVVIFMLMVGVRALWPELISSQHAVRASNAELIETIRELSAQNAATMRAILEMSGQQNEAVCDRLDDMKEALEVINASLGAIEHRLNGSG